MNVGQLLDTIHNNQISCVAGFKGLSREVTGAQLIDTPEILMWVKGGEIVMSAGYVLHQNPEMIMDIIPNLNKKQCAGLAFKAKRYFDEIPETMIQQAEQLDFPLLELSYEMSLSDFAEMIYSNLFTRMASASERLYILYNHIMEYMLEDADISRVLNEIVQYVLCPVFLLGKELEIISCEIPKQDIEIFRKHEGFAGEKYLFNERLRHDILTHYRKMHFRAYTVKWDVGYGEVKWVLFSISIQKQCMGYLCFCEIREEMSAEQYQTIQNIATAMGVYMMKANEGTGDKIEEKEFVRQVLMENALSEKKLRECCIKYDFPYQMSRLSIVIEIADYEFYEFKIRYPVFEEIALMCKKIFNKINKTYFRCQYKNQMIYFLYYPKDCMQNESIKESIRIVKKLDKELGYYMKTVHMQYSVGIGSITDNIRDIAKTYSEAVKAIRLGGNLYSDKHIFSYTEDITYHSMNSMSNEILDDIYNSSVRVLDEWDEKNSTNLAATLEVYYKCKYNRSEAAKELYVHRNTLLHRLDKIEELTMMSLSDPQDLMKLDLGLYARRLIFLRNGIVL